MIRSAASKVVWVGRATSAVVGLAILLALAIGAANSALAHTNVDHKLFHLNHNNPGKALTQLVGTLASPLLKIDNNGTGPALQLEARANQPPLVVNADSGTATNLSADKLDGKDSTEIGVNGWQTVVSNSALNSDSPKGATASCPSGKIVVGIGYDIAGGTSGSAPNELTDVVVVQAGLIALNSVRVTALEEEPTSDNWFVRSRAICATAP
jgi:hypothetical protein